MWGRDLLRIRLNRTGLHFKWVRKGGLRLYLSRMEGKRVFMESIDLACLVNLEVACGVGGEVGMKIFWIHENGWNNLGTG